MSKSKQSLNSDKTDEQKRLEYTARQKALYDYNTMMEETFDNGVVYGIAKGKAEGIVQGRAEGENNIIEKMKRSGLSDEQIKAILEL